jgi:L-seryl-tRNA(Ser) seleniumtransferase
VSAPRREDTTPPSAEVDARRRVPSVDDVLRSPSVAELCDRHGRALVLRQVRARLEEIRASSRAMSEDALAADLAALPRQVEERLRASTAPSLVRVINATGVVIHTNLGRAPLPPAAAERIAALASSYCNLEYDLEQGARGQRETHAETRLQRLLGAPAVAVVNNNAAAVLLAVNTFADGREALVSRGELVEIGGSFRVPDVLRKGGARLREVGTTNRTRLADYEEALGPRTGLILKVHPSNYRIVGFTDTPTRPELAELAQRAGIPLVEDLGSGLIDRLPGELAGEPTVGEALADGVDVVTWSGDKLMGGPQAGLVAGRRVSVDAMRRNPLYRALRVDKMTLAALDVVLCEHEKGHAAASLPALRMLHEDEEAVRARAEALAVSLRGVNGIEAEVAVVSGASAVGGGALPTVELPTALVAIRHPRHAPDRLAALLRAGEPPVVARVAEARLLLDVRTVLPEDLEDLRAALVRVLLS